MLVTRSPRAISLSGNHRSQRTPTHSTSRPTRCMRVRSCDAAPLRNTSSMMMRAPATRHGLYRWRNLLRRRGARANRSIAARGSPCGQASLSASLSKPALIIWA
jgi:hypothetical protein